MTIINKIIEKLKNYPDIHYQADDQEIKVPSQTDDGFEVSLSILDSGFVVNFDGWHEEFENEEEAMNCFGFGLSEKCRLKVVSRGKTDYKWIVESRTENGWEFSTLTSLLLFPFWRSKRVRYHQNNLIKGT